MNRRLVVAFGVLVLLGMAGCLGQGVQEEALAEEATYDWDTEQDVEIDLIEGGLLSGAKFQAVYSMENRSSIELYQPGFARERPLPVRALKYQYPNGTVTNHTALDITEGDERLHIDLPSEGGSLAFTANRRGQELRLPAYIEGSYAVTLPPGHVVGDFLLSDVQPSDYDTTITDGRMTLIWEDVTHSVTVRYYVESLQWVFWFGALVLGILALFVYGYYSREIARLREERERVEGDGDEPPP